MWDLGFFQYNVSFVDCNNTVPNSAYTWHLRLGHPNSQALKLVLNHCNFKIPVKDELSFCSACCMGKIHRFPSKLSQTVYNSPLELIYSDLWGPAPMNSHCQFRYYISFVDAYSRFSWIYFLKNKSDALSVFKQFKSLVELQFNKIKAIQTD